MAEEKKEDKKEEKKDGAKDGAAPAAPATAPSKKKLFLIIGGVVVLLVAIGVPVAFLALKPTPPPQTDQASADSASADDIGFKAEGSDEDLELEDGEEPLGAIYPLDTVLVNLAGGRFIRCQVQVEFIGRDVPKKFFSHIVPIRDEMIRLFTSRSEADVTSSKGKAQLKADIKNIIATITRKDLVKNIYFTQFIVQ